MQTTTVLIPTGHYENSLRCRWVDSSVLLPDHRQEVLIRHNQEIRIAVFHRRNLKFYVNTSGISVLGSAVAWLFELPESRR